MTFKTTKLRDAITFAITAGALVGSSAAIAQEQQEVTELDRVEVTGSRIKRVDIETSQPILTLTRQDIEATGQTSVGDVLQQISTSGSALNTNFNNGGNGQTQIDLRNLGANRTLVLVNGRRWVTGISGAVDLNTIPLAAVERVEVLKDGASALYGSDAIAGVVNVITRQDFDGASASALYGTTDEGDGTQQAYDFVIGSSSEKSSVMFGANYVKQEPVFAGDREISAVPSYGLPENSVLAGASSTSRFGRYDWATQGAGQMTLIDGATGCPNNEVCDPTHAADLRRFSLATDGFNFAPENYLVTPQERIGIFSQVRYDLADWVSFKAEAMYNERRSEQYLAPQPMAFGTTLPPGFNSPTSLSYTFNISADSIYNPIGEDITRVQKRMPSFSPRRFFNDVDTYRFAAGFDGSFEVGERFFSWDVGYNYADNQELDVTYGLQNFARVRDAVGPSMLDPATGQPICVTTPGDATTVIDGCVPLNLFTNAENMTQEMVDYINYVDRANSQDEMYAYTANISGDIVELPGGMMAFAAGLEHRRSSGSFTPDALASSGLTSGSQSTATSGGYDVDEMYLELNIPVLKDIAGADLLEFNVAGRYSDYSTFGDTFNPKFGFKWKPFEDLLIRGNWGEGFRAPSIAELYAGEADNFPILYDPCDAANLYLSNALGTLSNEALTQVTANCGADGVPADYSQPNPQIRTTIGGNPDLQPETSETKTIGFVYSPGFVQGLSVSLDWWHIDLDDPIQSIDVQTALDDCYLAAAGDRDAFACSLLTRDPVTGDVADFDSTITNQGSAEIEGYDINVSYNFETTYGKFNINWDSTYVTDYLTRLSDASAEVSRVGNYTSGFPVWRLRSNIALGWEMGDWDASLKGRYYSALDEDCSPVAEAALYQGQPELENLCSDPNIQSADFTGSPVRRIENELEATWYWDAQIGMKLPWNGRVALGINNLFDEDPPVSYQTFANSFDPQYEIPGQFYYIRYDQKF